MGNGGADAEGDVDGRTATPCGRTDTDVLPSASQPDEEGAVGGGSTGSFFAETTDDTVECESNQYCQHYIMRTLRRRTSGMVDETVWLPLDLGIMPCPFTASLRARLRCRGFLRSNRPHSLYVVASTSR